MVVADTGSVAGAPPADPSPRLAEQVADQIRQSIGMQYGFLAQTTDYVLGAPGKLLRPRLLLWACQAAGGDPERIFPAAAGTEVGHIASLIHDDIIDEDALRRGRAALHVQYGLPAAIITGDLLIFQTFLQFTLCQNRGIAAEHVLNAIRVLSITCIEMCEGQALESGIKGRIDTDEETYLRMIRLKTGSMCRAAAQIGAILAGAPEPTVWHLREYGERLGIAFQILDDMLSYEAQPDRLGKPSHSDIRNGRITLPIICALRSQHPNIQTRIDALFRAAAHDPAVAHARIADLLRECGALDCARARARRFHADAKDHLQQLPPSQAREHLCLLADAALARDH